MGPLETNRGPLVIRGALFGNYCFIIEPSLSPLPFKYRMTCFVFSELIRSSMMLMLPARPFIHHRSLQRVMQKSQNRTSCPPAEPAENMFSAIFVRFVDEGAVRNAGR
jgi:hypothetical protein